MKIGGTYTSVVVAAVVVTEEELEVEAALHRKQGKNRYTNEQFSMFGDGIMQAKCKNNDRQKESKPNQQ